MSSSQPLLHGLAKLEARVEEARLTYLGRVDDRRGRPRRRRRRFGQKRQRFRHVEMTRRYPHAFAGCQWPDSVAGRGTQLTIVAAAWERLL